MAATSFIVTIITSAAFDFGSTTSFIASIVVNTTTFSNRTFIVQPDGITAISNPIPSFFPAGSALEFYINPFSTSIFNPPPDFGDFLGTFSVETNVGQISSTDGIINTINGSQTVTSVPATIIVACLHGSSLIQMKTGTKRLDQLKDGDEILTYSISGQKLYTQVKGVAQCWISAMGIDHDAIVFEAGSLNSSTLTDEFEPKQRLIIDPGHPMCTEKDYLENGYLALRPAGTYWEELKGDNVYSKKWADIFVEEPSIRYDLILEEPFNNYVANGIIVRSKGYKNNTYKQFV